MIMRRDEHASRYGYDVHRLAEDRKMILGGVEIPYEKGLLGHSDADVLVHAIMDALLGAAALGDIGKHFPDTDPEYKGISSIRLLKHVGGLLDENRYMIENIDATIIAQRPKMRPYIDTMRQNIADALCIEIDQVNVKATTEEATWVLGGRSKKFLLRRFVRSRNIQITAVRMSLRIVGCAEDVVRASGGTSK